MPEQSIVTLTDEERQQPPEITHQNKVSTRRFKRAQIPLLADDGQRDDTIAQMLYEGNSLQYPTKRQGAMDNTNVGRSPNQHQFGG